MSGSNSSQRGERRCAVGGDPGDPALETDGDRDDVGESFLLIDDEDADGRVGVDVVMLPACRRRPSSRVLRWEDIGWESAGRGWLPSCAQPSSRAIVVRARAYGSLLSKSSDIEFAPSSSEVSSKVSCVGVGCGVELARAHRALDRAATGTRASRAGRRRSRRAPAPAATRAPTITAAKKHPPANTRDSLYASQFSSSASRRARPRGTSRAGVTTARREDLAGGGDRRELQLLLRAEQRDHSALAHRRLGRERADREALEPVDRGEVDRDAHDRAPRGVAACAATVGAGCRRSWLPLCSLHPTIRTIVLLV